ncbi:unnamed protein product [Cuscuta epithymum]|uniref:Uncharacterized protein n=2 Tax=Cuscuta epithymum TaxID=186058 RepID=A0AAV0FYM0_9ASTE|nr:unnamed protein product [Cuscuta epithymum]
MAKPGCPDKCGGVDIHFPFGIGKNCFLNRGFNLSCDQDSKLWTTQSHNSQTQNSQSQITAIDYLKGQMEVLMPISRNCFNESGGVIIDEQPWLGVPDSFTVSSDSNMFFTVGCNTYGYFNSYKGDNQFSTACISKCNRAPEKKDAGKCSGFGCCQIGIPAVGMRDLQVDAYSFGFDENVWKFNNCSYSFVAKNGGYNFSADDITNVRFNSTPLMINWAAGNENQTCESAAKEDGYVCGSNTVCVETEFMSGYNCKCIDGYGGNPYLPIGCQNIDECIEESTNYPCVKEAKCKDSPGNYTCTCPNEYEGDGKKQGTGCKRKSNGNNTLLIIGLSLSIGVTALLIVSFYIYWGSRKRRLSRLREQFFHQNGGILLQQQIAGNRGPTDTRMKIFTLEDLKKATNNFDEKMILGQGGYGTVYKGVLEDKEVVAIKKSKICDKSQVEQFINEVVILSQINHRNVVKLFGCCLETEVPLLVYEFITNGSLYDHLHKQDQSSDLSWATRLRVASESAGALSYLHSAASPPIIHRDVKTANILLDQRLTAKVADFGASRLVPLDRTQITTLVQGTFGYLDPEYFHTGQLTDKSDVYSFGVVLAELLTGQRAISFARPEEDRNLSAYFVSSLNNGRLSQIIDNRIVNEVNFEKFMEVAKIARQCLKVRREDRPTMKEVAMEIEGLRILERHPWGESEMSSEETEYLLKSTGVASHAVNIGDSLTSTNKITDVESMELISMGLSGGR